MCWTNSFKSPLPLPPPPLAKTNFSSGIPSKPVDNIVEYNFFNLGCGNILSNNWCNLFILFFSSCSIKLYPVVMLINWSAFGSINLPSFKSNILLLKANK